MSREFTDNAAILSWRATVWDDVYSATARMRRELDFPYYGPRPVEWVREARDAADTVISAATGKTWPQFCANVIDGLEDWRERWSRSEIADPDGYGICTLDRFITSLRKVADLPFAKACTCLNAAATERETASIRSPYA